VEVVLKERREGGGEGEKASFSLIAARVTAHHKGEGRRKGGREGGLRHTHIPARVSP
jgi:hypothetical protein